jgi:hypothetical protein
MSARAGRHGVVSLPALDVRSAPDHRAELRSQLLMGEVVARVASAERGRWWKTVNRSDGYIGWVRAWGVVETDATGVASWLRRARYRVIVPHAQATTRPGGDLSVSPLFWNDRLIAGRLRGRFRRVELPDGRRGWVARGSIARNSERGPTLVARVMSLFGIPYLWGGRTPFGLDCSAFTQLVLAERGVLLPRDAIEQFRESSPLGEKDSPREGDLVFFGAGHGPVGHVGLVLGEGYYAHARGHVRLSSTDPDNPLCDKELLSQFRGFRRPVSGGGSTRPGRRGGG